VEKQMDVKTYFFRNTVFKVETIKNKRCLIWDIIDLHVEKTEDSIHVINTRRNQNRSFLTPSIDDVEYSVV